MVTHLHIQKGKSRYITFITIVLTFPFWFPYIGGYEGLDTKIMIWAMFALGFDLLLGYTGYLSFGHAAFFGTSAYATGLMLLHYSSEIIPAMIVSVIVTSLVALIIGFLTLQRSGIYFAILTLAFGEMFHSAALSIFQSFTGGDNGLTGLPSPTLAGYKLHGIGVYYLAALILLVGFWFARTLSRSPFGLMLRAIKSNQNRLEYTGIDVFKYKLSAFVISAIYASFAGSMMVIYEPYVASEFMQWLTGGKLVIMSVIGGVGTLFGPMLGAAFMLYFENVVSVLLGGEWLLFLGIIFILIVTFIPGGFMYLGGQIKIKLGFDKPVVQKHETTEGL